MIRSKPLYLSGRVRICVFQMPPEVRGPEGFAYDAVCTRFPHYGKGGHLL